MSKKIIYIGGIILALIILLIVVLLLRGTQTPAGHTTGGFFGIGGNVSTVQTGSGATNVPQTNTTQQKIFEISAGPVASATFIQTSAPTTTVARYIMQDTGHILDLSIDIPGAVARPVSNLTIPGVTSAVWGGDGTSTILQYVSSGVLKSLYMQLASTTVAATVPPSHIEFLPNSIMSLALSPDGTHLAYLLQTTSGADGYVANADGTDAAKLFSLPLSQLILSWPSKNALLVQTKSAGGVPGIALSINTKTGAISPLLYTPELSAVANKLFSKIIYRSNGDTTKAPTTYAHDVATGKDTPMANNPLPEKCVWSAASVTDIYCALPLGSTPVNYIDVWHQGLFPVPDSIIRFNTNTGVGTVVTLPGDGGVTAPADQLGVSADGKYLYFITRGDQSLWGVRLTN